MELIKTNGGHSVDNFALYKTEAFHKALLIMRNNCDASSRGKTHNGIGAL